MLRPALVLAAWVACGQGPVHAQEERGSLTEEFPNMSAKQRARIAAKEVEEAGKDANYQQVMEQAERSFQAGRYEEALKSFEEARALRPYNVYPKVKIEDLRALLAKRAVAADTVVPPEEPSVAVVEPPPTPIPPPAPVVVPVKEPAPEPRPEPKRVVVQRPAPVEKAPTVTAPTTVSKPADGVVERQYREGQAFVIERAVTEDGHLVTYKRVFHPHGQVFYFQDGLSVDERVWKARFPDR